MNNENINKCIRILTTSCQEVHDTEKYMFVLFWMNDLNDVFIIAHLDGPFSWEEISNRASKIHNGEF